MQRKNSTSKYQELVNKFIADLERGVCPWSQSWTGARMGMPLRHNGEAYRGFNVLSLWYTASERGYEGSRWMTFNQALELGGHVRKGAKAGHIFKYGEYRDDKETSHNERGELRRFVRTYCVFNTDEIEGLPAEYYPAIREEDTRPEIRDEVAESFIFRTGAEIRLGGSRAFYDSIGDYIRVPTFNRFDGPEAFYCTLLHELVHWSGAPGRVDRPKGKRFGDPAYAMEELVAELGAAFLASDLALSDTPREDHAAYLASWVKGLRAQPSILMTAAGAAQKACDYLHGRKLSLPGETPRIEAA